MAPGGRQPVSLENIKTQKPASQKKSPKPQPQCVSNSAAASGLLARPDDGYSHKSAWHLVPCAAAVPTPYQGWVLRAGPPALSGVFLSIFFLRR